MNSSIFKMSKNVVTVTISADMTLDNIAYRSLKNGKIPFLLPYDIKNINNDITLSYKIDENASLTKLSKSFSANELFEVYLRIISTLINCENYSLNNTNFCQDIDTIFLITNKIKFLYAPVREYNQDVKVTKKMLESLLNNCPDTSNLDLMKIYRYFSADQFSLKGFQNLLINDIGVKECDNDTQNSINSVNPIEQNQNQDMYLKSQKSNMYVTPPPGNYGTPPPGNYNNSIPPNNGPNFGEFVMPPPMPKTDSNKKKGGLFGIFGSKKSKNNEIYIFDDGQNPRSVEPKAKEVNITSPPLGSNGHMTSDAMLTLIAPNVNFPRLEYQIPIVLINDRFSLGRQDRDNKPKTSDYEFDASIKSISRKHAIILRENDAYYLMDINSSNGTYLNDERLKRNVQYLLNYHDKISFSKQGIEYLFTTDEDTGDETMLMFNL